MPGSASRSSSRPMNPDDGHGAGARLGSRPFIKKEGTLHTHRGEATGFLEGLLDVLRIEQGAIVANSMGSLTFRFHGHVAERG